LEGLDDDIHARIVALSEEGKEFERLEQWEEARSRFTAALALVPEPKWNWEASTWLFIVLGDVAFHRAEYEQATEAFRQAMLCPGAIGNPFVHLRRGQTFFELGEMKWAEEELAGAYMLEGTSIFEGEDPKYFEHLKTVLKPPKSGQW